MRVDNKVLDRWQQLDARKVLLAVADHAKEDVFFVPAKNAATTRWHRRDGRLDQYPSDSPNSEAI
jgi:hypothetical protein|tara:strand:+ start:151 stop:345 length:195 start_codon:yes stop_codon:yes gene_type:complete